MDDVVAEESPAIDADLLASAKSLGIVPGLMWAFWIHEDGSSEGVPIDRPIDRRRDGWLWLHLNLADRRSTHWLGTSDLPETAVTLLCSHDTRQRLRQLPRTSGQLHR
ncbi:MAG: hypothetical protein WDN48_19790 [Pseudolabrys sp.]